MKRKFNLPLPVMQALHKLGQDISDARRRRRIPMALMAERAGISRITLAKIEKGDPSTWDENLFQYIFALSRLRRNVI